MYCSNCGQRLADDVKICPSCKAPVVPMSDKIYVEVPLKTASSPDEGENGSGADKDRAGTVPVSPAYKPQSSFVVGGHPMKWFYFVIHVQLILNAALRIPDIITYVTGGYWVGTDVYQQYPVFRVIDLASAAITLLMGIFAVFVRMRLAGFYRNGPAMYYLFLVLCIVEAVLEQGGLLYGFLTTGQPFPSLNGIGGLEYYLLMILSNMIGFIVLLIVNIIYFTKRRDLFVNKKVKKS